MADVAMAVRRATRLIPCELWPWPTVAVVDVAAAEDVVVDMMEMWRRW